MTNALDGCWCISRPRVKAFSYIARSQSKTKEMLGSGKKIMTATSVVIIARLPWYALSKVATRSMAFGVIS